MDRAEATETLKKVSEHVKHDPEYGITFTHQFVCAYEMALAALQEQEGRKWVSVEDRLPDAEKEVRVLCKASWNPKYLYQCHAFYVPKGKLREESDYNWDYECCEEYSEEDDDYFVNPGWYERIHNWDDYGAVSIVDEVTHWMPLPEPPEEGA